MTGKDDDGYFVNAKVNGKSVTLLCDSGANVSILNSSLLKKWGKIIAPCLTPVNTMLLTVTGESKPFQGKSVIEIKLGGHTFQHEVLFADITQDGILGIDFMIKNRCDLIISRSCLKVKGEEIPCYMSNGVQPVCCRVALVENVSVPAESEIIVPGKPLDHLDRNRLGIVEPSMKFVENTGVLVAKVLVDPKTGNIPLRLANFSKEPIRINRDTVTAVLQPVESVDSEKGNFQKQPAIGQNSNTPTELPEHLVPLFDRSTINLDTSQKTRLQQFLVRHQDIFSKNSSDIGHTTLIEHHIDVQNSKPVKKIPYRIPLAKRKVAEQEIEKMVEDGIIEKCPQSAWNAPVVMVTKPDNSIRFCCDFRGLNEVTVKDCQALPRIDDSLDALSGSKWWSCLDMKNGYWQVDIAEENRHLTAFSIPGGEQWQWRKLAFGLCNAPSTFTRLMQMVFSGLLWKVVILYLDDIICHSKTFDEQFTNLEMVFERLRKANLKLNPKKCHLFQKEVTFLGHTINENGVGTSPDKIQAVKNWPTPRNAKEAKSFISLASYYRSYVYQFATIAKPIHQLAEKNKNFEWTEECEESFQIIKDTLCSAPLLAFPTETDPFVLDCDASNVGQGAVLSQIQNGEEKVICYFSRCFSKAERNYCVTRRELLAVVNAIKHFHHYLYGNRFTVRSDHGSLRWLLNFKILDGQLARMLTFLSAYDFSIQHRAGRLHSNCDALSRRPCIDMNCKYCERVESKFLMDTTVDSGSVVKGSTNGVYSVGSELNRQKLHKENYENGKTHPTTDIEKVVTQSCGKVGATKSVAPDSEPQPGMSSETPSSHKGLGRDRDIEKYSIEESDIDWDTFDNDRIRELQIADPVLKKLHDWKESEIKPEWCEIANQGLEIKYYWHRIQMFCVKDGVLYRRWESENGKEIKFLLVVPKLLRQFILAQLHDSTTGAHLGIGKTLFKIRERFFWYAMKRDVEDWCERCEICGSRKVFPKKGKAPMKQYNVGLPMERVAIDFMGPFTRTNPQNGNAPKRYIMVIGDYFTKWTEAIALENIEAKTVARALIDNFICRFGVPLFIHTDQGSTFESRLFQEICQVLGIKKTRTTKARPQSDGMIERANRTILNMLSAFVSEHQRDWDEYVPLVMMAYRSSVHESTSTSPSMMTFGREIRLPIDLIFGQPGSEGNEKVFGSQYARQLEDRLNEVHEFARNRMKLASDAMKRKYDIRTNLNMFEVGDSVWLFDPVRKIGLNPKLQRPWKGPFKVIEKISDILYRVKQSPRHRSRVVHHDKLRKYKGSNLPVLF
ncbi:MAG: RNase H-like domain-containing protein [Candidatus Thiodiazotropha endolucinida]|nr:DDE-type integrase/transposase/recombinase [Candidatus Thiodiazotropha taylori]MCW4261322.1 RNase H-like domain-containing protein [Candidatus Thiodiazotropha endolucinida]